MKNPAAEVRDVPARSAEPQSPQSEPDNSCFTQVCAYCGRENHRDALHCCECGTREFKHPKIEAPETKSEVTEPRLRKREFRELTPEEMKLDLVTLLTCRNIIEADMVVGQLGGVGIPAFIPDEFLMQAMSWNVNAYGYVRVQVSPNDYERAKTFSWIPKRFAEPGTAPNVGPASPTGSSSVDEGPPSVS